MGPDYFRIGDTKALYIAVRDELQKAIEENKKVNFPLKITSGAVENEEVRKLYNFILFSEPHFESRNVDRISTEVINNLKGIRISEEIEKIRKKMIEYEKNRNAGNGTKEKYSTEYDELYRKLIELEKEKINLKLI